MNGYCSLCGKSWVGHGTACPAWPDELGRYHFTPYSPTAEEIRRIVREELERAKDKP